MDDPYVLFQFPYQYCLLVFQIAESCAYVAAKVNWWLNYTLSTDFLVRVYFTQRLWLKYTLTKESLAKVYFNQCLWLNRKQKL